MENCCEKHELNELVFPASYFEDEVREGFYVPSMMKRYWAGQLKVLSEIDRVCRRHSIRWFAVYGTLMGAVRHGGYIPWDDDLDICMLRKDYERFFAVAGKELPKQYSVLNVHTEPKYELMIGRIVNNKNVIDFSEEHMKEFMDCPYTIGVDVFPLDNVYDDEDRENDRIRRLKEVAYLVDLIGSGNGGFGSDVIREKIEVVERDNHVRLRRGTGLKRDLLLLSDKLYSECKSDTGYVALMPIWVQHRGNRFPGEIFDHTVMLPFENTSVPVPGIYDEFLRLAYGDYMIISRRGGVHDYPVYGEQESILSESIGHNPYRYTFSGDDLRLAYERKDHKPTDVLCGELADMLYNAAEHIERLCESGNYDVAVKLLEGSQGIAISLGTLLEGRTDGCEGVVRLLEEYCELLYRWHECILEGYSDTGDTDRLVLQAGLTRLCKNIREELNAFLTVRRKRVLFLSCKARRWDTLDPYYNRLSDGGGCRITVASLPYYRMDVEGTVEMIDEAYDYPPGIKVIPVTEYDFEHQYADEIIIQIPYDGTNTSIRVPEFFYSDKLLKYTDKLTYIPYLDPDAPEPDDVKAVKSMETLIEQPAVVFADRIILKSEDMKTTYIKRLTEIAGEDTGAYWNGKIDVVKTPGAPDGKRNPGNTVTDLKVSGTDRYKAEYDIRKQADGRKVLMYYVDVSYLLQYGVAAIEKMKHNMDCFDETRDKICCLFVTEDRLEEMIKSDEKLKVLKDKYCGMLDEVKNRQTYLTIRYDEAVKCISTADAYYGSAGVLAHKCRLAGRPVMIIGDAHIM